MALLYCLSTKRMFLTNIFCMENLLLYQKIMSLPKSLRGELEEFINSLKKKVQKEYDVQKPSFGSGKGIFKMKKDFDAPMEDFQDYM